MYIQVMTAIDDEERALALADTLVAARLAGCVQVLGPVTSVYWWQGERQRGREWLLLCKSRQDLYPELERCILANHPYDCPEILSQPLAGGSPAFLAWLDGELRRP